MTTKLVRVLPPLPQTERGAFCNVGVDAPGERVIYCSGTDVLWRTVAPLVGGQHKETPDDIFCWRGHTKKTTCAAISPNSQWVVSGDVTGAIRVWGAKGDHIQKNEYRLWNGVVKDIAWSGDSARIVASGDGKEVRAVAMLWETGSKTGEVGGHAKQINSISFRSQRPFRVVTGGEDMLVAFHAGPPFKFTKSHTAHSNFVNSVRYSPDGEFVVSAGSDSKLILYEGKEGELIKEFAQPSGISGSLWSSAWSPDSARVATAGGDKKLRIWGVEAGAQLAEATVGTGSLEDMQIGVAWPNKERVVSVCLDGRLLFWDVDEDGSLKLAAVVDGTQGPLNCVAYDFQADMLLQGGADGFVLLSPASAPPMKAKIGKGVQHILTHTSGYSGSAKEAWVFALDDKARRISLETGELAPEVVDIKEFVVGASWLDAEELHVIATTSTQSLVCISSCGVRWTMPNAVTRRPTAMACSAAKACIAVALEAPDIIVGGVKNNLFTIQLFAVSDAGSPDGIAKRAELMEHRHEVSALKFSPSGEFLASADAGNKVMVWTVADGAAKVLINEWTLHTSRVTSLDWFPDGRKLISGALDQKVHVWNMDEPKQKIVISEAHKGGVFGVVACGEKSFASAGFDGFVKVNELE